MPCTHKYHKACIKDYATTRVQRKLPIDCPTCRCCHYTNNDDYYKFILEEISASNDLILSVNTNMSSPQALETPLTPAEGHLTIGVSPVRTPRYAMNVVLPVSQSVIIDMDEHDKALKSKDIVDSGNIVSKNFIMRNKVALLASSVILMLLITMLIVFL
jgi:hypothetical protein